MKRVFQLILWIIITSIQANTQVLNVPSQHATIQAAIDAASEGDTVLVAEGTYMENLNMRGKGITLASQFLVDGNESHIAKTIIDGSAPSNTDTASVIYVPKGSVKATVICGLTITKGKGTLTLREIVGDAIRSGGGIFIDATSCIVKHNIVTGNVIDNNFSRVSAAGILARQGSGIEIHILNNTISNNKLISTQAVVGAGIVIGNFLNYNCKYFVENNIISGNVAQGTGQKGCSGAGIACWFGLPTQGLCKINNNLIENNQLLGYELSTYAGGILIAYTEPGGYFVDPNPVPEITNNVIRNNSANPGGGAAIGIWTDWNTHSASSKVTPQPVITNNTVVGNISSGAAGIFNWRSFPLVMNNIFWNTNLDPVRLEELYHVPIPAYGANNGVFYAFNNCLKNGFFPETNDFYANNIKDDPGFEPDTFILAEGSPCIAAGIDSVQAEDRWYYAPDYDYFYGIRPDPVDQYIDIGACESKFELIDTVPPILMAPDSLYQPDYIEVTSSEDGFINLVPQSTERDYNTIQNERYLYVNANADVPVQISIDTFENGSYGLYAFDKSGNISEMSVFTIYGVGIQNRISMNLSIYPNPTSGYIILNLNKPGSYDVEIISSAGQLIYNETMSGIDMQIDLTPFSKGIYFVTVRSAESVKTKKIIKL